MCMHEAPQPHYWQTAWLVYAPQRQLASRIPALIKESDGAITFSILSLSPISTSERDKHGTRKAKCYGAVRNINSAIKIFNVSHFVSVPFSSRRITAAHLWWDILSSPLNYLEILRFNIMVGDLRKSHRYTDCTNGALNRFNVIFRFAPWTLHSILCVENELSFASFPFYTVSEQVATSNQISSTLIQVFALTKDVSSTMM